MSKVLHIDFETASYAELGGQTSVGLHNYVIHFSTVVLMLAWAFGDEEVELWLPHLGPMPERLRKALEDPNQKLGAFNSSFERYVLKYKLGIDIPIWRFEDAQPSARYLSLPGDLDTVGEVLRLPDELKKDKEGDRLIKKFCYPSKRKKKRGEPVEFYFKNWESDPEDWEKFCHYCRQDVRAEREVVSRLAVIKAFPLPFTEREIWKFDQTVNERGIPVDLQFVVNALHLAEREKEESVQHINKLTGLENSNSPKQMLEWVKSQGYEPNSLKKEVVQSQLDFNTNLTPLCIEALELRKTASSTTYKKLATIIRQISPDGRLRNQFVYMGSSRCGRWSGNGFQFHNMARPDQQFEDLETVNWARSMIYALDYDAIKSWFGSVLRTVKNCIRTIFVAGDNKRFNVCDLNAIETRVGAWVAGCDSLLQVFRDGKDPYIDFAVKLTGIPYETLMRDLKSKDPALKAAAKAHRQFAKPGVLGCVYRLGGGELIMVEGLPVKTGMWKYAEGYGIKMDREKAHEVVRIFREAYKEIPEMWYILEKAVADVLKEGTTRVKREVGPGGCIKIDKLTVKDRNAILRIQLPSGRYLHYMDARIEDSLMPWKAKNEFGEEIPAYKPTLVYAGINQKTHQWDTWITSHGGKIFENIVQGIARDILAYSLVRFENDFELPICGHVHDEGISQTDNDGMTPGVARMELIMSQPIDWAPGLPLKADGFEATYYHK